MNIEILMLAIEKLRNEVKTLSESNQELRLELDELKNKQKHNKKIEKEKDEFLSTKQVQELLGVCYNTLQKIVRKGLITPIRINQRRVIYSKKKLLEYLYRAEY